MPLVILSGPPLTFKSTFGRLLYRDAIAKGIDTLLIDPEYLSLTPKNYIGAGMGYVRKRIKDAVARYLTKSRLVIVDSTNHAKSFRYELFCTAREVGTSFCVVRTYRTNTDLIKPIILTNNENNKIEMSNAISELSFCIDEEQIYKDVIDKASKWWDSSQEYKNKKTEMPLIYKQFYKWSWEDYEDLSSRFEPYVEDAKWEQPSYNLFENFNKEGRKSILDYLIDQKNALRANKVTQISDKMFE